MQVGVSTWYPDALPGGGASAQPLRAATTENRVPRLTQTPGRTNHINRVRVTIGSGDYSELRLVWGNFYMSLDPTDNATVLTVVKAAIENSAGTGTVPITFGGSRSKVLASGDYDIVSDAVLPSAFGLTKFTRGEQYWLRFEMTQPDTLGTFPRTESLRTAVSGQQVGFYDPAVTTLNNGVDGTGTITVTGTAITSTTTGYRPMVVGRFVSGDARTYIGVGDSVLMGQGGGTPGGFFQMAMFDVDGTSNPVSSINFGVASASTTSWLTATNAKCRAYLKYCNTMVEEFCGNDIGPTGAGDVLEIQSNMQTIWGYFRAVQPGGLIIRTKTLPHTDSTDSWATLANQTIRPEWGAGQKAEAMDNFFDAQLGVGVDYVVQKTAVSDPTDLYKWAVTGAANYNTADGVHPSLAGHTTFAAGLRAVMATLPA